MKAKATEQSNHESSEMTILPSIPRFGIVAAMSRNRIIGINGRLPWSVPEDRTTFQELTRDKILIIGRNTYNEETDECHICHAKSCIVVSTTADDTLGSDLVKVARSFPEALAMAKELATFDENNIHCWVAGGERLYEEALRHKSAKELHLTVLDLDLDPSAFRTDDNPAKVALFPRKYIWDRNFVEVSKATCRSEGGNTYTRLVYARNQRQLEVP